MSKRQAVKEAPLGILRAEALQGAIIISDFMDAREAATSSGNIPSKDA
jgi:hypothetical protein